MSNPRTWDELQHLYIKRMAFLKRQSKLGQYLRAHPIEHSVLFITRNKNDNVVCYAVQTDPSDASKLHPTQPIVVFWQDLATVPDARFPPARPLPRDGLKPIIEPPAYGVKCVVNSDGQSARVVFNAAPSRPMTLTFAQGAPHLVCEVAGCKAVISHVHIDERHVLMVPKTRGVLLWGRECTTNKLVREYVKK